VNGWQDVWPEQKESRPQAHRIGLNPEPVEIDREAAKAAVREAMGKLRVIR